MITKEIKDSLKERYLEIKKSYEHYTEEIYARIEEGKDVSFEEADHGTFLEGQIEGYVMAILDIGGVTLLMEIKEDEVQEQEMGEVQIEPGSNGG